MTDVLQPTAEPATTGTSTTSAPTTSSAAPSGSGTRPSSSATDQDPAPDGFDVVDPGTGLHSAIYEGTLAHARRAQSTHAFSYDVAMAWLALDELPGALDAHPLWSARRPAPMRFRREDFHGPVGVPLGDAVRATVAEATGSWPTGGIRLLANLRTWGWSFNPIAFYFVLAPDGRSVETLLAEVTNTPWHERHPYVIPVDGRVLEHSRFAKALHVSPFMDMDLDHDISFSPPGADQMTIRMDDWRNSEDGADDKVFSATLGLQRRPLDAPTMGQVLRRHPMPAQAVSAGIYRQALALRRKGAPFRRHPKHSKCPVATDSTSNTSTGDTSTTASSPINRSHS